MADRLWVSYPAPAWLDGSPGGSVRLVCDVHQTGRVTALRLEVPVGCVGRFTVDVSWQDQAYTYTSPNLTDPLAGFVESKNVPSAARVTWVDALALADGETYTGPVKDGVSPSVSVSWVNPDGAMTTEQRAEHERGRGGG